MKEYLDNEIKKYSLGTLNRILHQCLKSNLCVVTLRPKLCTSARCGNVL